MASQARTELIVPGPAKALASLLGVPMPDLEGGEGLPLLWHWLYTLDRPAQADPGRDGHPVRGAVPTPPGPGRRRMWAGGRVQALGPLRSGEPATRRTQVLSTNDKQGRSGRLTFLTVGHQIVQGGRVVVDERQELVYREMAVTNAAEQQPEIAERPVAEDEWALDVTPTLLFRFSALTYNGHRIHHDREYAREARATPAWSTHGPLQALAMTEAARARGVRTTAGVTCDYRLIAPLFDSQGLIVSTRATAAGVDAAVRDITGRQTARATIETNSQ